MIDNYISGKREKNPAGEKWRPAYHFSPPKAWMNDPNGLIYFKGWYHLFYQYYPESCEWGMMHWGHAVSRDMFHWKDLPIALMPDKEYDMDKEGGCFSGSAVEKDGVMYLFYTAAIKINGIVKQTQCMAMSEDGVHFVKYEQNPLIESPPQGAAGDFRDPKVFKEGEKWYMVIGGSIGGADNLEGDGRIFLYSSADLYNWEYCGVILESSGKAGTMFECPDMFCLDGKWIVTSSPMRHPENNKAMYCVGNMDFEKCKYEILKTGSLDDGYDFYAPQSFLDEHGNRVIIAWQNGWQWMPWWKDFGPTEKENWRGTMSVPRKVSLLSDNTVTLYPVSSLDSILYNKKLNKQMVLTEKKRQVCIEDSGCYMINFSFCFQDMSGIEMIICSEEDNFVIISIDTKKKEIVMDNTYADNYDGGKMTSTFEAAERIQCLLLVDKSSIEIYINSGIRCMTANVYPEKEQSVCYMRTMEGTAALEYLETAAINPVW